MGLTYSTLRCLRVCEILRLGKDGSVPALAIYVENTVPNLILEESEVKDWILEDGLTGFFLGKEPGALRRDREYEQLSLF